MGTNQGWRSTGVRRSERKKGKGSLTLHESLRPEKKKLQVREVRGGDRKGDKVISKHEVRARAKNLRSKGEASIVKRTGKL